MGTATPDVRHNQNYSPNSFQARGGLFETGVYVPCDLGSYTTVGDPTTFGLSGAPYLVIFGASIMTTGNSTAAGVYFEWDWTNETVRAFPCTGLGIEGTTTWSSTHASCINLASIRYIAFSW